MCHCLSGLLRLGQLEVEDALALAAISDAQVTLDVCMCQYV